MPPTEEVATESKSTGFQRASRSSGLYDAFPNKRLRDQEFRQSSAVAKAKLSYVIQLVRVSVPLVISDLAAVLISLSMAFALLVWLGWTINHFSPFLTVCSVAVLASLWLAGCYPAVGVAPAKELRRTFRGCVVACAAVFIGLLVIDNTFTPYHQIILVALPAILFLVPLARCLTKDWMQKNGLSIPFYFVGDRQDILKAYQEMSRFSWTMLSPAGRFNRASQKLETVRVSADSIWENRLEDEVPYLGTIGDVIGNARRSEVNWLFFVGDPADHSNRKYVARLEQAFPQIVWIAPERTYAPAATSVLNCGLAVGLRSEKPLLLLGSKIQKRIIDIVVSSILLILCLPIFIVIALCVRLTSRGPILLKNPRIGQDGQVFHAWKFRSMVEKADEVLESYLQDNPSLRLEWERDLKLKEDPRITSIGKIIRKSSLDELPQLWNVLIGQMSLVGPRPILTEEVVKYGDTYEEYLKVRPGITGLWQVSGRNGTSYPERLVMVRYYVRYWSPWLDLHILIRTIRTVLLCEGSY